MTDAPNPGRTTAHEHSPRSAGDLIVDDTALTRRAVRAALEPGGFVVHEVASGAEALSLAPTLRPDLVMLDIELPDINGLEVARQLKEHSATSRTPIVHLSATRVSDGDLARGLDAGADAYLTHPAPAEVLVSTVRALLRVKTMTERIAALQNLTAALSSAATATDVATALLGDGLFAAGAIAGTLATTSDDGACSTSSPARRPGPSSCPGIARACR